MEQPQEQSSELQLLLQDIRNWQDFTQGQVEALRVALYATFRALQSNAEFRALIEIPLEAGLRVRKEHGERPGLIAGYESALRDLVGAFHAGNSADTAH